MEAALEKGQRLAEIAAQVVHDSRQDYRQATAFDEAEGVLDEDLGILYNPTAQTGQ